MQHENGADAVPSLGFGGGGAPAAPPAPTPSIDRRLADALCARDVGAALEMLAAGANANRKYAVPTFDGRPGTKYTPLYHAAAYGKCDIVRLLLDAGAQPDTDAIDAIDTNESPLAVAAYFGYTKVVRMLVAAGANVRVRVLGHSNDSVMYHVLRYRSLKTVTALVAAGAPVDEPGYRELDAALRGGWCEAVAVLCAAGARPTAETLRAWIYHVSRDGLPRHSPVRGDAVPACRCGDVINVGACGGVVNTLLEPYLYGIRTLVWHALHERNYYAVRVLIENGAWFWERDAAGRTSFYAHQADAVPLRRMITAHLRERALPPLAGAHWERATQLMGLPDGDFARIASHLALRDWAQARLVCKTWRLLIDATRAERAPSFFDRAAQHLFAIGAAAPDARVQNLGFA